MCRLVVDENVHVHEGLPVAHGGQRAERGALEQLTDPAVVGHRAVAAADLRQGGDG
jgi:hypothetical protein